MTGQALTITGLDAALLRAAERHVRFLTRGQRVRHANTGAAGTVVCTEHRQAVDGHPGWRLVIVDVDHDPDHHTTYRTGWIDQLVEEDTTR